jgi:hypothetical protein
MFPAAWTPIPDIQVSSGTVKTLLSLTASRSFQTGLDVTRFCRVFSGESATVTKIRSASALSICSGLTSSMVVLGSAEFCDAGRTGPSRVRPASEPAGQKRASSSVRRPASMTAEIQDMRTSWSTVPPSASRTGSRSPERRASAWANSAAAAAPANANANANANHKYSTGRVRWST